MACKDGGLKNAWWSPANSSYIPLCGESASHQWIPPQRLSNVELWCFLFLINWWTMNCLISSTGFPILVSWHLYIEPGWGPGGCLNIKMLSYQYRDYHVKDKTVSPTVLSLTWEFPYLGQTVFILRWCPECSGQSDTWQRYWYFTLTLLLSELSVVPGIFMPA